MTITQTSIQLLTAASLAIAMGVCTAAVASEGTIKSFDCDDTKSVITKSGVTIDKSAGKGGKSALKLSSSKPTTFRLFEVETSNLDNVRLVYRAKLKTKDVKGKAYLEMWCHFPDKGEFFSRGLEHTLTGTNEWTSAETPFFLKTGEKPDRVKLNLVLDGSGEAWINDVELSKTAL